MQEQLYIVLSLLRSTWRFRWWSVAVAWAVCVAGWAYVASLPDIFLAQTRVYIDTSSSLERVLDGKIIPADVEAQLNYVRQNLLGTVQLEEVARGNDLHLEVTTGDDMARVVDRLRRNIAIVSDGGRRNEPDNLYTIRFKDTDPTRAVNVVQMLLNTFVDQTRSAEVSAADTNQDFLQEQLEEYEVRLRASEDSLARFKKENAGKLPGVEGGYFARLQGQSDALLESRKALDLAQSRRQQILRQLNGQAERTPTATPDGNELPQTSIEARIADAESNLETLLLRFTDRHPDVIALSEQLAELNNRREQEIAALSSSGGFSPALQTNPVFQALQISLNEVEVEIANLSADVSDRERAVHELRSLINEVPEVEAELARLNRDYEVVHAQYQVLLQSLETENLSTAAQQSDNIDFRVIDPPATDVDPVEPARGQLIALVLAAGLALGGGVAFALSQVMPVFSTRRAVTAATGLPVLGTVSLSVSQTDQRRRMLQASGLGIAILALLAAFGGVFALEVMGPGLLELVKTVILV